MNTKTEAFLKSISGKRIALCGIGRSHLPLIPLFTKYGAHVIACDKRTEDQLGDAADEAVRDGAVLSLGEGYIDNLDIDIFFRTPGMKFFTPELLAMRERGVVVTSEMEVFFDLCPCKIIAVTGSDGKTTTTTVISEMLKAEGKTVMQEYIDAKRNIVLHQNAFSRSVLNLDNDISNSFEENVRGELLKFSRQSRVANGAYMNADGDIFYAKNGSDTFIMNKSDIKIPGLHNVENYLAAICAVWGDVSVESIVKTAKTFGGVAHRNEFVRELDGVSYYNDSIASSPTRTALGTLSLYDEKMIVILGGYDKHLDYTDLGRLICKKVKTAIIMGATAEKIKTAILGAPEYAEGSPVIIEVNSMEEAVAEARKAAAPGDRVSLSPASASFDLYKNFEERGEHFKSLVNKL